MYSRNFSLKSINSYFIYGARGTGKTSWLKNAFSKVPYFDLLDASTLFDLKSNPKNLIKRIGDDYAGQVIIDEIQKYPELLDEIHRLIEERKNLQFILTGSSARKLRKANTNLLAGRALVKNLYPLTADELGDDFSIKKAIDSGMLPTVWSHSQPKQYLKSYVQNYVDLEVKLEGFSRNINEFSRFLQTASFSQASVLNISQVAQEAGIERKTVTNYFTILNDLLLSYELPVFSKRAKRDLIKHRKFFFFDVGVFKTLRPQGPLDNESELNGPALETLILEELVAHNSYSESDYEISYWRTRNHIEVDFILYGKKGLFALEVKNSSRIRPDDFLGLETFLADYPIAKAMLIYGGDRHYLHGKIEVIPVTSFFKRLKSDIFYS